MRIAKLRAPEGSENTEAVDLKAQSKALKAQQKAL